MKLKMYTNIEKNIKKSLNDSLLSFEYKYRLFILTGTKTIINQFELSVIEFKCCCFFFEINK